VKKNEPITLAVQKGRQIGKERNGGKILCTDLTHMKNERYKTILRTRWAIINFPDFQAMNGSDTFYTL